AIFRFSDYEGTAPVIFGEETDKAVLGVVTLEVLGLQIDQFVASFRFQFRNIHFGNLSHTYI
ncbi:unnamed protein product, partial [marine sediment metagenome]